MLFNREDVGLVKIDIRYLVLVTSVEPLVLHVDKVFWLRFANKYTIQLKHGSSYHSVLLIHLLLCDLNPLINNWPYVTD